MGIGFQMGQILWDFISQCEIWHVWLNDTFLQIVCQMSSNTLYLRQHRKYSGSDERQYFGFPRDEKKQDNSWIFYILYNCNCK